MMDSALSLVVIRTLDMAVTLKFYQAIGLGFEEEQHGSGPVHYSCDLGGIVLEIYPEKADAPSSEKATMLGFKVASLDETLSQLENLGIQPKSAPREADWGRWSNVVDPDGRTIQLSEAPKQEKSDF